MLLPDDQITALKAVCPSVEYFEEGKLPFVLLRDYPLPPGVTPTKCDLILCPRERDGYPSRLWFSTQVSARTKPNWNGNTRLLERNWHAYSWKADGSFTLVELLAIHLKALR